MGGRWGLHHVVSRTLRTALFWHADIAYCGSNKEKKQTKLNRKLKHNCSKRRVKSTIEFRY